MDTLATRIKTKRQQQRISAEYLAQMLNVTKENIYKWERGSKPSDPEVYNRLMKWLGESEIGINQAQPATDPDLTAKYIKLLERELEFLQSRIEGTLNRVDTNLVYAANNITAGRAEIRAAIDYTVMKDSQGNEKKRGALMAQINKLIHLQLTGAGGVGTDQSKDNANN